MILVQNPLTLLVQNPRRTVKNSQTSLHFFSHLSILCRGPNNECFHSLYCWSLSSAKYLINNWVLQESKSSKPSLIFSSSAVSSRWFWCKILWWWLFMLILWYNSFVFDLVSSRCDHWSLMGIKSNVLQLLDAFTSFTPGLLTSHTKYRRSNAKLCSENLKICLLVKPRQFCDHHIISSSFLTHKINKIWRKKNFG